ncbi:MAG TPA: ABC transporter permease [Rhodopila sp.]|uniref:ABC transporter permease n=1 Tax=Rhodopila sp. TaxID=2480087 RepID=UPI002B8384D1|nr:ABC transporter permease [Rhodopila sp.]HVY14467.1 ABC transporter permease [Rhodopila sp.]
MLTVLLRRIGFSLLSLVFVSAVLFALTRAIPDSPARIVLGTDVTQAQIKQFEHDHGLDKPIVAQYVSWLDGIFIRGTLGTSFITGRPVGPDIVSTLPVTLELVVEAFVLALILSIAFGTISALLRDTILDYAVRLVAVLGVSIPGFWAALLLIMLLAVDHDWFPPGGFQPWSAGIGAHLDSIALPVFCLGIFYMAVLSRMTRSSLLEVLGLDYMRTARAAGLPRRTVLIYALRNALVPVITVAGMSFGYMFGWALIIESVFNISGLSYALLTAIQQRDFTLVQGIVMVFTFIFIVANLVADMTNMSLNPRLTAVSK